MEFFISIYNLFLFQPVFNALIWLTQNVPGRDFGVAVILLTIAIRLASYPLGAKAVKAQKKLVELQPKMKEVQEKFKGNAEEQRKAMSALFKKAQINPFASFAPFLIQIPIFIVLYQIFSQGLDLDSERFTLLYSFIETPEQLSTLFFGIVDLNEPSFPLALGAGVLQFLQLRQMKPKKEEKKKEKGGKPDISSMMQKQMMYILPVLIVWIAASLPAAFGLYIATTTIFSMWQHWFISKKEEQEGEAETQTT